MTITPSAPSCLECGEATQPPHRRCLPCHIRFVSSNPEHVSAVAARSPQGIDWPALMATAERRRIPVSRVDHGGEVHILRTTAQLAAEWGDVA